MLNIGDSVVIRKDLQDENKYGGIMFHHGMRKFLGKTVTIATFPREEDRKVFMLKEDLEGYVWSSTMLGR